MKIQKRCQPSAQKIVMIVFSLFFGIILNRYTAFASVSIMNVDLSDLDESCRKCHPQNYDRPYSHFPAMVGLCKTCHDIKDHHLSSSSGLNLKPELTKPSVDELCYRCHDRQDTGSEVHGALKMGKSCANCHNPHGDQYKFFLRKEVKSLCTTCHNQVPVAGKSVHGIINGDLSCANCHNPHSSNEKKLLYLEPFSLCLSCHDKPIAMLDRTLPNIKEKLSLSSVHAPASGDCLGCHSPHASAYSRLLNVNFPGSFYNQYLPGDAQTPNTYALCFQCHDSSLLKKDISQSDTQFRNDTLDPKGNMIRKNLHWFHVVDAAGSLNKNKGRSCAICHSPHGASQDHHINAAWRLKREDITIEFTPLEKGGQCNRTCHNLRTYKRLD